ncbi:MAG: substrate-binding domain-containing protein, partial [Kineosporiaceae bacterium]|nr:substrate-binding domain-containing protein [Aeromicrobium sp.]
PGLSSIDMNFKDLGRMAARLLFRALAGEDVSGQHVVAPSVIVRDSTLG